MDFPGGVVTPTHVSTWTLDFLTYRSTVNVLPSSISKAWPAANQAAYVPVALPYPYPVNRVFWINGATGGGNVDFGIYTPGGRKIYSTGSTAQSGTDVIQYVTPSTTFTLAPGRYLFAMSCSGTTGAVYGYGPANAAQVEAARLAGWLQEASALPLPATATFATVTTSFVAPFCGVTRTTTGY